MDIKWLDRHGLPLAVISAFTLSFPVFSSAAQAADLGSQTGANITVSDGDHIIANTGNSPGILYGVMNPGGSTGTVNLGNNVTVSASDPSLYAKGIVIQGNNSILSANALTVDISGATSIGLDLSGNYVNADLGTGSSIKSTSSTGAAYGVIVGHSSTLNAEQLSIETSGNNGPGISINDYGSSAHLGSGSQIKTNGQGSFGVYIGGLNGNSANGPAHFTATDLTIDTQGYGADGMNVQNNAIVDLGTGSVIKTTGDYALGIWNWGQLTADALTVNTRGSSANGIEVRGGTANIGADSFIFAAQAGGLVTSGTNATINFIGTSTQRNSIVSGGSYGASAQSATALINLQNTDILVDRQGSLALGLWAMGGGTINGQNLSIAGTAGTRGVYAMTNSQIDLTGDLQITMASPDQMAIATQHDNGYAASRINASGRMDIYGSVASRGGKIHLDMTSGSVWTGTASSDNVNGGELVVAMNNSRWNVTGDASLDQLSLTHSTVDLASRAAAPDTFTTLNVANLSGNSTFVMRADIVGDGVSNAGDLLNVTGSSSGQHVLTIRNQGSQATTGNEVLTVVHTPDGAASFTASSQVELGGYLYDVRKNGTDWELYATGGVPAPVPAPDPSPAPAPAPAPAPTTTADAGGNYLNVGYLMNYEENRTLMQRMGDLHNHSQGGNLWLRGYGGEFDAFASGKLSGFDMHYSGTQFGGDRRITEALPLYIGLFIGSTHASPDYRAGNGTARSDYLGMYASYVAHNGFYSDMVLKASRQKNDFHVLDSQNNGVSASGSSGGLSASVEAGRKFSLNPLAEGFYIEPQAQFTYSHQNAMGMKASNGLDIELSRYESLLGRASVVLGYEATTGSNRVNMYLKTGAIREFAGDTDYRLNGSREQHSFRGNGWNNGVGVSAQINQQHTLYLEADYTHGTVFDQKQISGGYRFSF